jgi:cyclopropane fatty-acyl-phospholipid synthase-like methyltransferase
MKSTNPVLTFLRGPSGSIVYRFWKFPLQRLSIAAGQLRGVSWVDFYSRVVDRSYEGYSSVSQISEKHLALGAVHLDILERYGLRPEHTFLDFGCGIGRSAQFIVEYLEPGRYVGVDISQAKLRLAAELIERKGLTAKQPAFILTSDLSFDPVAGRTFDYMWAHSVFNHTPEADVHTFFQNARKIVRPGSALVLSTIDTGTDTVKRRTFKDWSRPLSWWERLGRRHGFVCESYDGWTYPDDMPMRFGDRKMILKVVWQ